MTYNLLKFPNGVTGVDRKVDLRYILQEYQPDIFSVCELQDETGANTILDYCLQTQDNKYSAAVFEYNHSGYYQDLNNMLYYNNQKFDLVNQTYILTYLRDINRYTLKLLTPDHEENPIFIEVYVAHLKASSGEDNEDKRLDMVEDFIADLNSIPSDHFVIFTGDFNMYTSAEPAYQKIIDSQNPIIMKDPLLDSGIGNWDNSRDFEAQHTQSTHTVSENDYVGGGLDDRFDFIFLSENFFSSPDLSYSLNTYIPFGNNGNCFNKRINDTSCTGTFSLETRNHLYNMSDHLPITLELETTSTLAVEDFLSNPQIYINEGNPVGSFISFNGGIDTDTVLTIYDISGKQILKISHYIKNSTLSLETLKPGIYFAKFDTKNTTKLLRFIKS